MLIKKEKEISFNKVFQEFKFYHPQELLNRLNANLSESLRKLEDTKEINLLNEFDRITTMMTEF